MRPLALLTGVALTLGLGACGDDEEPVAPTPPAAQERPSTAQTGTTRGSSPQVITPPREARRRPRAEEDMPGGPGDEEGIRVPATFRLAGARVTPASVAVPSFLRVEVALTATDGAAHRLRVDGRTLRLAAGARRATLLLDGLKPGRYPVTVDGRPGAAAIVSGAEPGP